MGSGGQRSTKGGGAVAVKSTATSNVTMPANFGNGLSIDEFAEMSEDECWDIIEKATAGKSNGSYYAWGSDYQRFINNSGLDAAPELFDDDALDNQPGIEVYRTVYTNSAFTAGQITDSTFKDNTFLYNAGGGQVYGKGMYSATSTTASAVYQGGRGISAMMRFKVDRSTMISESSLVAQFNKELKTPGSLASKINKKYRDLNDTHLAIYAVTQGYTSVNIDGNYIKILTRQGLKASKKLKDAYACDRNGITSWSGVPDYKGK